MNAIKSFKQELFRLTSSGFEEFALHLFKFQAANNPVYNRYIDYLDVDIDNINKIEEIPFLPISFFKSHSIKTGDWKEEITFRSSGTTGQTRSEHPVPDLKFYETVSKKGFEYFFGPLEGYSYLGLLPSYLERNDASLVYMVDHFIKEGGTQSGFYLSNHDEMVDNISKIRKTRNKIVLIGVTFALLEVAEKYNLDLSGEIVIETGGMKGRKKEMIREEVHNNLKSAFNLDAVHSEYGMTELMSQAYSRADGVFECPPWMKVLIRDMNDPLDLNPSRETGGINVIDLANIHSCSFVETEDLGRLHLDGKFEILGRLDNSEVRGCNLMVTST